MSRSWRIEFDGALYHILSRGNEQQKIFADDQDRNLFLELIGEMSARFDIIESPEYLLRLSCYIHRNPLRAKMVKRLADYRWSSYRVYAYGKKQPDWLKTDLIFSFFDGDHEKQILGYRKKVQFYSHEEKELWEDFRHGFFSEPLNL
ncbi:MAG: hypothetical protein PF482_09255 [Desulfobacteraceae bacterium]|nr:hypothetical protein [Desulfobacteraceae bacterium]